MKKVITILLTCLFVFSVSVLLISTGKEKDVPVLKGEYLGQTKPGLTPQLFAPGFISTGKSEFNAAFSPDGKEFYYSVSLPSNRETMMYTKLVNNQWTKPRFAAFLGKYNDCDPFFSLDGNRLYFISTRSKKGKEGASDWDIWYVERTGSGWSNAKNIGPPVNSDKDEYYVSLTKDKTIYFASNRKGGYGSFDIYCSKFAGRKYLKPKNLGTAVNSKYLEHDPFIAVDESYIIFTSVGKPGGYGSGDLYISFRQPDGSWTKAKNMGDKFNTAGYDFCPIVSPDGKFLFFTRKGDIFWVDIKVIGQFNSAVRGTVTK